MHQLVYLIYLLKKKFVNKFNSVKKIKLAVIGTTAAGKTYLLADIVGSLERLGYIYKKDYSDHYLHRTRQNLLDNQGKTTPPAPHRQKDIYSLRYELDGHRSKNNICIEFIDVPGETMTKKSLNMFNAIKDALLACDHKVFEVTSWWRFDTRQLVRTVKVREKFLDEADPYGIDWNVPPRDLSDIKYLTTAECERILERDHFKVVWSRNVSGKVFFKKFLDYDTDSALDAIKYAWNALKIDEHLPEEMHQLGGKDLFELVYKNHFFCHYYTYTATDLVVCDLCCAPAENNDTKPKVQFNEMIQVLRDMFPQNVMAEKHWYLALKGVDLMMCDSPYRELLELISKVDGSGDQQRKIDVNLIYSHFLLMLAKACHLGLFDNGKSHLYCDAPATITADDVKTWLTMAEFHPISEEAVDMIVDDYNNLSSSTFDNYFKDDSCYSPTGASTIDEHIRLRIAEFCMLHPELAKAADEENQQMQKKIGLPLHTYFVATPIDENYTICDTEENNPNLFSGLAKEYNHRAHFGSLQLTIDLLLKSDLDFKNDFKCYGGFLKYFYDKL